MTLRRLLPYVLLIPIFLLIYLITMIVPTKILYGGADFDWVDAIRNTKLRLQMDIFIHGLTFALLMVNLLEICTTANNKFALRLLKSLLTIVFVYIGGKGVYWLIGSPRVWNLYYYHRGAPAGIYCIGTIIYTGISLIVLELVQLVFFGLVPRAKIARYIPYWLWLEKTSTDNRPVLR